MQERTPKDTCQDEIGPYVQSVVGFKTLSGKPNSHGGFNMTLQHVAISFQKKLYYVKLDNTLWYIHYSRFKS